MINLSRNKKHKIRIKVTAILIAFMFLFENTGYCALDVARNKSTLRPPMAFSKETRKATVNRYDALLRKNEHEVQTVDPAITSSRTLRLRGERRSLDAGAEESKRSIEKLILMPGLNAEMQVKILMTQEELSELETFAHKVGDDNIATLFNKAIDVLALQGSNVSKLEKKSILLALIGSGESENLFEDGRDTNFIGINRTFFNIADLYPQVARILFIAGIAREL